MESLKPLKENSDFEGRILVLAPSAKDAELTETILKRAGINCHCFTNIEELFVQLDQGASALVLPEERVSEIGEMHLDQWLKGQPAWSDLPVVILAIPGADSSAVAQAMDLLGNVTVIERPMRISSLVSTVRTALRARQRQYQIRDHLLLQERNEVDLRAADQRKDEFLAILAHELRNPLSPIRHALDILRMKGSLEPESEKLRALIERQVDHMVRLVDDLLEVSRITRGQIELREEVVDIAQIITAAIETSRPLLDSKEHVLKVSFPQDPLYLEGDRVRLAQVFSNLLTNAAKYTDPGGTIILEVRSDRQLIEITIRDNGTGISQEMLARIFDMFAQADGNAMRAQGGLGIGLTLVKSLVEMHGGSIFASSPGLNLGSQFLVRLPRTDKMPKTIEASTTTNDGLLRHRFLVVDDNQDAVMILGKLLEMLGAEVRTAFSGTEALEVLAEFNPTAVVLDIGMPDLSGHEVAQRIRKMPRFQDVPLIALSGWGQAEDRRQSRDAGFDHHLVKPVDIDVLKELIASLGPRESPVKL